jgi:uncharacterized membrane protein YbhN (UPF0104 family)
VSAAEAHLACVALLLLDLVGRALRIQILVRGLGARLGFLQAVTVNAIGDAAAGLTPLRFAGEPVRLAVLMRYGVAAHVGVVAIGIEVITMWPVIILFAAWLSWRFAPAWLEQAAPQLAEGLDEALPWVLLVALLTVATWVIARRFIPKLRTSLKRSLLRAIAAARRLSPLTLLATVPLTLANLAGRVGILIVLTRMLSEPPPAGLVALGSFLLLYSQLYLPTPSGAGAVDLGFIGGAAGALGPARRTLLLAWRFYTTILPIALGVVLALHLFGRHAAARLLGRRRRQPEL